MRIGELRIRILRVMQYFAIGTFISSLLTAIKVYDLPWWLALSMTIALTTTLILLYYFDPRVARGEAAYLNDNNEILQALLRDIGELKRALKI
jgi:hypothetical protein